MNALTSLLHYIKTTFTSLFTWLFPQQQQPTLPLNTDIVCITQYCLTRHRIPMVFPTLLLEDRCLEVEHSTGEEPGRAYFTLEKFLTLSPSPDMFKKVFWNILNALAEETVHGRVYMQMHANSIYLDCINLDVKLEPECDVVKISDPYAKYPVAIEAMATHKMQIAPEEACYNVCGVYTPYYKLGQMLLEVSRTLGFYC